MPAGKDDANAPSQLDRFKEAARALECDEDEAAFDEKLKGIAKRKVPSGQPIPSGGASSSSNFK